MAVIVHIIIFSRLQGNKGTRCSTKCHTSPSFHCQWQAMCTQSAPFSEPSVSGYIWFSMWAMCTMLFGLWQGDRDGAL